MPYVDVWVHLIWATKNRQPFLIPRIRSKFLDHIRKNAESKGIHLDFINGVEDHIHALISLKANQNIARIVRLLKGESSRWMNRQNIFQSKFQWQKEYIALSVSDFLVNRIRDYIKNQESHHKKKDFSKEYQEISASHPTKPGDKSRF